ncbi:Bacterial TniB protein [compost metagenome]
MMGRLDATPQTGEMIEDMSAAANKRVADIVASFRQIFIPYPRHIEFHSRCDYLVQLGQATKGAPQKGMRVLAPSGSGKTTAARAFAELIERRSPPTGEFKPVLMVSLDRATTVKKLFGSILAEFGDGFSDRGTEQTLRKRVLSCFGHYGTQLLIIDEVQHLNFRSTATNDVTDSLKSLLDTGVIPIVFIGTEDAEGMFKRNLQLNGRLLPPCDFLPLRATVAEDAALFTSYWRRLDQEMVQRGLIRRPSGLEDVEFLGALHKVSAGVIGRVSRLTEAALEIACRRSADRIELYDFMLGTERWALAQNFVESNPFRSMLK